MLSYPKSLEKYASQFAAFADLPEPNSNKCFFRLVRLPCQGIETFVDISEMNNRLFLRISRILSSARSKFTNSNYCSKRLSVEISSGYIKNSLIQDSFFRNLKENRLKSDLEDDSMADHYFAFFTDSYECYASGITNPHSKKWAELWQFIINRSYGLDHVVGRRHLRTCNLLLES